MLRINLRQKLHMCQDLALVTFSVQIVERFACVYSDLGSTQCDSPHTNPGPAVHQPDPLHIAE